MILVDTSVWVRFLSNRAPFAGTLDRLLDDEAVVGHEFVMGELLVGDRGGRRSLLTSYGLIPQLTRLPHVEVVEFVRARRLLGLGIGWIDVHLLAAAVANRTELYTADNRLFAVASQLGVAYRN